MPYILMRFEWDNNKRKINIAKHYIDFADAVLIFNDPARIEMQDKRHNYREIRYKTIGMVENTIMLVVYTKRSENLRIISARKANKNERKTYLLYSQ